MSSTDVAASATPIPPVHSAPPRGISFELIAGVVVALSYFGLTFLQIKEVGGIVPVDLVLVILVMLGIKDMARYPSVATSMLRGIVPWWWLGLLASFLALAQDGLPRWAVITLVQTTFALLFFLAGLQLLSGSARLRRIAVNTVLVSFVMVTALLALGIGQNTVWGESDRATATFPHPNYAAHYMVLAAAVLTVYHPKRFVRLLAPFGAVAALLLTASFGGMLMSVVLVLGYLAIARPRYWPLFMVVLLAVGVYAGNQIQHQDSTSETISAERFDRSSNERQNGWDNALNAWRADPLGVGPGGVSAKGLGLRAGQDTHSDWVATLAERGVLGLIALLGTWATVWYLAPRGGLARAMIPAIMIAGFFRDTFNYRHLWLLLALAIAFDGARRRRADQPTEVDAGLDEYLPGGLEIR